MPFVKMGSEMNQDLENKPVPAGEYDVKCVRAELYKSERSGNTSVRCMFKVLGHDEAANVFHYLPIPTEGDDPEKVRNKLRMVKRFTSYFGIEVNEDGEFDTDEIVGAERRVNLTLREFEGMTNNQIELPPVVEQGAAAAGRRKAR